MKNSGHIFVMHVVVALYSLTLKHNYIENTCKYAVISLFKPFEDQTKIQAFFNITFDHVRSGTLSFCQKSSIYEEKFEIFTK